MPAPMLELHRVTFAYKETQILDNLTLAIPGSAVTAVLGQNGSGKSTLLDLIVGIAKPRSGQVNRPRGADIAFAPQRSALSDSFPITVEQAVEMGRWRRLGLLRRPSDADRSVIEYWLTNLGLDSLRRRRVGELSGGQRQRVLLAQAFTQQAPIVVLDEPTTGLDADVTGFVAREVGRLARAGTTVVLATHDVEFARRCDHCALLGHGAVLAVGGPADVLTAANLATSAFAG